MANTIKPDSAYAYTLALLDAAKENLSHPDCALSFFVLATKERDKPPVRTQLTAVTDFDALESDIETRHLKQRHGSPFSFIVMPNFDAHAAQQLNLSDTTLTIHFRPVTQSRQLGWRAPQPPGTPDIVESATLASDLWRMTIELERAPLDDLVPPEEPQVITWGSDRTLSDFKKQLGATLWGIEYGHDVDAFGEVQHFGALGLRLDNSAVRATPPAAPALPKPPGGWAN